MSGMQLNMDFSAIKPNAPGAGMFPASDPKMGWLVRIIDSGQRENSKGTGVLCVIKYEGLDQAIAGQTAEVTYNVTNPNQQAVDIAFGELSAIAHVTGRLRVGNTAELHGAQLRMIVGPQKDDANRMEAKGYLDVNGNPPGKAGQGPLVAQPAAFGGQQQPQQSQQPGGFGPGNGQQPQGGFQPGGGQPQQQQPPAGAWTPPAGQQQPAGGAPGWTANPPNGQQPPANGAPANGWHGGNAAQNGGQPDWSRPSA